MNFGRLDTTAAQYVAHKQSMGIHFQTESRTLKSFCRSWEDTDIAQLEPEQVRTFLSGTGSVARFWQRKHEVLLGFYRFAMTRGYVTQSPLPRTVPKPSREFVPYVFLSRRNPHAFVVGGSSDGFLHRIRRQREAASALQQLRLFKCLARTLASPPRPCALNKCRFRPKICRELLHLPLPQVCDGATIFCRSTKKQ